MQLIDTKAEFVVPRPSAALFHGGGCHGVGAESITLPLLRHRRHVRRADRSPCSTLPIVSILFLLLAFAVLTAPAVADGGKTADGLRLTYEVAFGSIPVGRSYYSWVPDGEVVWISKELAPSGPLSRLYRVRDRFVARVRGADGRSELLYEDIDEPRDRRQERWSLVDWERGETTFVRVNHTKDETDREALPAPQGMQWPLTLPYWIARQPAATLDGLAVPLLDGTKLKEVRLRVVGEETIKTDIGRIACHRIDGEVWYRGERQRAGSFQAWRRKLAPHIPVRIVTRLKFGTLKEMLVSEEAYGQPPSVPPLPVDTRDRGI
jgi:hypothetical protein